MRAAGDSSNRGLLVYGMGAYYNVYKVVILMDTKDVIFELRTKKGLSRMNLLKNYMLQGRRYPAGKTEKQFQIQKL